MSLSTNTTYRVFVEKLGASDPAQFVGNAGEVFLDPSVPTLKLSDGSTAGGVQIGGGGGGESYWVSTTSGIHTLSNVGVGTTNPQTKLQVGSTFDPQVIGFGTVLGASFPGTNVLIGNEKTGSSLTPQVGGSWKGLDNNFIGAGAGKSTTTGNCNNFFGLYAGSSNTTGYYNNFFGLYAGNSNTTGTGNIFIGGYTTGTSNTVADNNIFLGQYTGNSNTTGEDNVFLGQFAGRYNTLGEDNIFLGRYAGRSNTTGNGNIFLGLYSGNAFNSTTDALFNVCIGKEAGAENTSGSRNVYIGLGAGDNNPGGSNNVFLGRQAGRNTEGNNWSIYLGAKTGIRNTSTNPTHKVIIGIGTETAGAEFDSPDPLKSKQLAIGIKTTGTGGNSDYWIVGNENFDIGIGTTNPTSKLTVQGGDIRVGVDTTRGVVLTSPNGTQYRLIVDNSGNLSTSAV
jgi:hypothetical protein